MPQGLTTIQFLAGLTELERGIYRLHEKLGTFADAQQVLEIGSGWGVFAGACLRICDAHLTTVDKIPDLPQFDQRVRGHADRVTRIVSPSSEALPDLPDNSYDVVFVDGDHRYEGVASDLEQAYRLVRTGGKIVVDDVLHAHNFGKDPTKDDYGVTRACVEFSRKHGWPMWTFDAAHGIAVFDASK